MFTTGCSVFKDLNDARNGDVVKEKGTSVSELASLMNLSDNSFYIKNMVIDISDGKDNNRLIGSLRFESPDKYLIALRSRSGIEVSRIFINQDSIFIVDRIKKKIYCGSAKYIEKRYGIPLNMLPVLLGDFKGVCGLKYSDVNKNGTVLYKCSVGTIGIRYEIDKGIGKVRSFVGENRYGDVFFSAGFEKFKKENLALYPSKIYWSDLERSIKVEISIQKIEYPWIDKIQFSVGSRYEVIELL